MHAFDSSILDLYAKQYGVASGDQLRLAGLTRSQIERLVTSRQLISLHGGVYRMRAIVQSHEAACLAATLADDELAVSHQSAARLSHIRQMYDVRVHVTVAHGRHPIAAAGVRVHRSGILLAEHIVVRPDGIRVTTPARTMFDLAAVVGTERLESAVEHALQMELTTYPELWQTARTMAKRGRPGSGRFLRLLHGRPASLRPVASDLELRLERALIAAGLPRPVRQHPIRLPTAVTIHPDLAWPETRWALEVDHVTWHGGIVPIMEDAARDRQLRLVTWAVERVTDREITTRLDSVVRDLVAIYHQRCAAA